MKVALTELITMGVILAFAATVSAEQRGIRISPDKNGNFQYTDDFNAPKFLRDTVAQTVTDEFWQKGAELPLFYVPPSGPIGGDTVQFSFDTCPTDVDSEPRKLCDQGNGNLICISS